MVDFLCWHVAPECFLLAICRVCGCLNSGLSQGQGYLEPKQATHWQSMYCFKNIKKFGYWDNIRRLILDVFSPPYAKKLHFLRVFGPFWAKIVEILLIFGHFLILDQNVR